MKKLLLELLTLCCIFCLQVESAEHAKILAAYWGLKPVEHAEEQLKLLKTHGLNTALVKDGNYETRRELWRVWAEMAQKYEIRLTPVLNFAGVREIEQLTGQYRPYIDRHGKIFDKTPCPLDENYWELALGQRFMRLAQLAPSAQIAGLVFDTEMYGSGQSLYRDLCFCDNCWARFCRNLPNEMSHLPKEQRFAYLVEHQLVERYEDVQQQRLQDILAQLRRRVHAVDPGIFFGFLAYRSNWFYAALIQGLGTTEQPVSVFTESSYISGYTPSIAEEQATVHATSPYQTARYIPGIWLGRFFPDELPSQLYSMATNTDGYWLFTTDSLWDNTPKQGHYAVHGSIKPYWHALRRANSAIEAYAAAPETSVPDFLPLYPSSFYHASSQKITTPPSLQEVFKNVFTPVSEKFSETSPITYRGRTLFHGFKTDGGTIRIHHVPIGSYTDSTHYMVFDAMGNMVREARLNRKTPSATLSFSVEDSGIFSLLTNSGANATQVVFTDLPYLIEASVTFPCATINSPHSYRLHVLAKEQASMTIRARCSGEETALLQVQSADARLAQQIEIHDFIELNISASANNTSAPDQLTLLFGPDAKKMQAYSSQTTEEVESDLLAWKISVLPIPLKPFEDVTLYLYNYPFPYLLPE